MHRPFVYFGNALVTAAIHGSAVVCKCLPKVSVSSENLFVHVFFILDVWSCFASRLTTSIAKGKFEHGSFYRLGCEIRPFILDRANGGVGSELLVPAEQV